MPTPHLLPQVNSKGVIKLAAPFVTVVTANIPYTIAAVRRLSDFATSGLDPFALYYEPAGLSQEIFENDVKAGVCIISLQSPSDEWVYVPNSYLLAMPDAAGVAYSNKVVAVNLGALPDDLSLDYFKTALAELAHDLLGVTDADVRSLIVSAPTYLSQVDHATFSAARKTIMGIVVTNYAKYREAERLRVQAIAKIAELENHIRSLTP
jgi:hypothetical protein